MSAVADPLKTPITTLKLAVTGECNLQCFYCRPLGRVHELNGVSEQTIAPAEYGRIVKAAAEAGVERVLIAGAEPLLRKDIAAVAKAVTSVKKIDDIRFITNGTFLKNYADALRRSGIRHIEINVDSLDFMVYQKISRCDSLHRVLDGLDKLERVGFETIVLNVVVMQGVNNREIIDFAMLTKEKPISICFLEYKPRNDESTLTRQLHFPAHLIKRTIEGFQSLQHIQDNGYNAFRFADGIGQMRFCAESDNFLSYCEPHMTVNSHGQLYVGKPHGRTHNVLKDLERDTWEDRLKKVFMRHMTPAAPKVKTRTAPEKSTSTKGKASTKKSASPAQNASAKTAKSGTKVAAAEKQEKPIRRRTSRSRSATA